MCNVWVQCEGGSRGRRKEGLDTSKKPRFVKILPAQGKRKINSFLPQNRPTLPDLTFE